MGGLGIGNFCVPVIAPRLVVRTFDRVVETNGFQHVNRVRCVATGHWGDVLGILGAGPGPVSLENSRDLVRGLF